MVSVSVIVSAHNEEDFIGDCLDSLLSQDYEDFEIVVVEDGSTDRTREVVEAYLERSEKVRMLSSECKTSAGIARNRGVAESRGRIVAFTDADCVTPRNWVRQIVDLISKEDVVAVGGPDITHPKDSLFSKAISLGIERGTRETLRGGNSAYLRTFFVEFGGFDESVKYDEDLDFQKRMRKSGFQLLFSPDLYVYHRRRSTAREYFFQCFWAVNEVYPLLMKHGIDRSIQRPLILTLALALFTVLLWTPPFGLSRSSILLASSLLFVAWAWRGPPQNKAHILLPVVYAINYVATIAGGLCGLVDHVILPIISRHSLEEGGDEREIRLCR